MVNTSNYYKSISKILADTQSVSSFLVDHQNYHAHKVPFGNKYREPEKLFEHIELVQKKFETLIYLNGLETVIDRLINNLFDSAEIPKTKRLGDFIKLLWANIIVFHDYGKINENFQANNEKMNNPIFKETINSPINTNHSSLGAFLYIYRHLAVLNGIENLTEKEENLVCSIIYYFSYPIFKHHGKYLGDNLLSIVNFKDDIISYKEKYLKEYQYVYVDSIIEEIGSINSFLESIDISKHLNNFALYSLVKLGFSLLTASDFLASGEYMTGLKVEDFGVLSRDRIFEMYRHVTENQFLNEKEQKVNFNKATFQKAETDYHFQNPTESSNQNLNILRQEMGIEVLQKVRKNLSENLFYIEAPTGGGKTNLSFLATLELLKGNEDLNKVYYVFPFTTLVTQTQQSLIETFGLSNDEVITLSSKSGFKQKDIFEDTEDDKYGINKGFHLENLFCLYPFVLMTHIKFFNILKTNEKSENYLLHRMANSVVVIDELQAYSPTEWQKVIYFIQNYAHFYNIKFIVMSATLPKLDKLDIFKNQQLGFIDLIENAREKYFLNPIFSNRVAFNYLSEQKLSLEDIAKSVLEKSIEYTNHDFGKVKPAGSVYTIIEFIFKKSATDFYEIITNATPFYDEVFVLSGTILEHRRKHIIAFLKNPENRKKKILLITTQVVEAGVDIDMDLGFKDKSLLDSEEQLAGRINRNVNKQGCALYLFDYNNEQIIYGKDKRHENTRKYVSRDEYLNILKTKNFELVYNKVLEGINEWDKGSYNVSFKEYEEKLHQLKFQSVHFDFKLISNDMQNISVLVPINIPISGNFERNELSFLKAYGVIEEQRTEVKGTEIANLYLSLIQAKGDYNTVKIEAKIMQAILAKFTFQLLGTEKILANLKPQCDLEFQEKTGIYYMCHMTEEIYSVERGLNFDALGAIETQFL
jgi:CRISPR-associated endonuclease/helicase Cas3